MNNEYPISDENEEEENNQFPFNLPPFMKAFLLGPDGPKPVNLENILKSKSKRNEYQYLTTILNNEYELLLIEKIKTSDGNTRLLLECIDNPNYTGDKKWAIIDAYNYLNVTHIINFVVSWLLGIPVWSHEAIDIQMQVVDSTTRTYSKIIILVDSCNIPSYSGILESSAVDSVITRSTDMIIDIPDAPIMTQCIRAVSYYNPVIIYDISFAFNDSSNITFEDLHIANFYGVIMTRYLSDACSIFYPLQSINEDDIGEKLIRTQFDIEWSKKLCNIKMVCVPAVYYNPSNKKYYGYCYEKINLHSFGTKPLNEVNSIKTIESNFTDMAEFINSACSSDLTQVVVDNIIPRGIVSNYCEEYKLIQTDHILFTLNRHITNSEYKGIIINCDSLLSNNDIAKDYWILSEKIDICDSQILGFVNLYCEKVGCKNYDEILRCIASDLYMIFNISLQDIESDKVVCNLCYMTKNIARLMITKSYPKSSNKSSKKRGWFGGSKK